MHRFGLQSNTEYLQQANDGIVIVAQIETRQALENVDAIAKIQGIDVLLVGPFDLGNNIGHPILDGTISAELKDAIERVRRTADENGKRSGIFATSGEQARSYAEQGFHMIAAIADAAAIPDYFAKVLAQAKGGL
ncbi:hypothetical protein MMC10_004131 [Thelotrema lepadinum]|nr:hypothetical protein [Thelotrema lepadinum]